MKDSTTMLVLAGAALYAISLANKGSGTDQSILNSGGTSWAPDTSGSINPYTMGYNPGYAAPAPAKPNDNYVPVVVDTKKDQPYFNVTKNVNAKASTKTMTKVAKDVFTKPSSTSNLAPGSSEDYAVAQNYARGLVGTKNAQGGYSYKL